MRAEKCYLFTFFIFLYKKKNYKSALITSVAKGETKLQTHKPNRETRRRLQKEAKALNKVIKKDAKLVQ